jgi:ankyrin repeat protein
MNIKLFASFIFGMSTTITLAMHQPMLLTPDLDDILRKNSGEWTPLHDAASKNDATLLKKLIEENQQSGKSVDVKDKFGQTPLWHAAAAPSGHDEAIQLLLAAGANINEPQGRTPLHVAARYAGAARVKQLLDLGARADLKTYYAGSTPLHELATWLNPVNSGSEDTHAQNAKEILKKFGPRLLSIKGIGDITPAHLAAQDGRLKLLNVFVAYGLPNLHETLCLLPAYSMITLANAHQELQKIKGEPSIEVKICGVHITSDQELLELEDYHRVDAILTPLIQATETLYKFDDEPKRKAAFVNEITKLNDQEIRYLFSAFHHVELKKLERYYEQAMSTDIQVNKK